MWSHSRDLSHNQGSTDRTRGGGSVPLVGRRGRGRGRSQDRSRGGARDTSAGSSHATTRRIGEAPPPPTPPSPPSQGSSDDEASNSTDLHSAIFLAPPEIIDGGKKLIYVAHLKHKPSKVPKVISNIVDDYWTGWPPHFGELSPEEEDAYVARFREIYTWHQRTDDDDVLKHLLSRIKFPD